jgi:hypothetical protein
MCLIGPRKGLISPILVTCLISGSVLANISYITATKLTFLPKLSIILSYTAALMGVWTQVLMFIVSCSDPGVVSRKEDNGSS